MNQIGWCMNIEQAGMLAEQGLNYMECPLSALQLEDEQAFAKKLPLYLESPIKVQATNIFVPSGMMVVGPQRDTERIRRYVHKAGEALSLIGINVAVLGSGKARMIPEGWEKPRAEAQILECLEIIADEWRGTGITLALEPLNRKESNIINSVAEAVQLVQQINSPIVRVLADFYHMDEENEPLDTLVEHKDWIAHIHIADTGRLAPGSGSYPYDRFTEILQEISYKGMISAECAWPEPGQGLVDSISFMKQMISRIQTS